MRKEIQQPNNNFIIAHMGNPFNWGVFTAAKIPAKTFFLYGGKFRLAKDCPHLDYNLSFITFYAAPDNGVIDGSQYVSAATLMQHLPSKEKVDKLTFLIPQIKSKVATANVLNK